MGVANNYACYCQLYRLVQVLLHLFSNFIQLVPIHLHLFNSVYFELFGGKYLLCLVSLLFKLSPGLILYYNCLQFIILNIGIASSWREVRQVSEASPVGKILLINIHYNVISSHFSGMQATPQFSELACMPAGTCKFSGTNTGANFLG